MRKFLSIILVLFTIFGVFAENSEWKFDVFDELDLEVLDSILETKIDEKTGKLTITQKRSNGEKLES